MPGGALLLLYIPTRILQPEILGPIEIAYLVTAVRSG